MSSIFSSGILLSITSGKKYENSALKSVKSKSIELEKFNCCKIGSGLSNPLTTWTVTGGSGNFGVGSISVALLILGKIRDTKINPPTRAAMSKT